MTAAVASRPRRLPREVGDIDAVWLTAALARNYPGVEVRSAYVGDVTVGSATRVRLLLDYNDAGHEAGLPPTMWLKGTFIRHDHTYDIGMVGEAHFYLHWAADLPIRLPKAYYAEADTEIGQGLVLLEDLLARNVRFGTAFKPLSLDEQQATLEYLAAFHARWWGSPRLAELPPMSNHFARIVPTFDHQLEPSYYAASLARRWPSAPAAYRDPDRIWAAIRANWRQGAEQPRCMIHGDPHAGNMYFERDGRPAYLDWQTLSGPYMHDVGYSLVGNITPADRRRGDRDLIAGYLAALRRNGVENPPDFEDAWLAYRRTLIHGYMWVACPAEMQPEEICAASAERFVEAVADLDTFGALGL
ncbi:MAG: phosphotransferase [Caulobacteraceae bacterium]|nr:phosphotransferase [Caulobacteraceae bacterium]